MKRAGLALAALLAAACGKGGGGGKAHRDGASVVVVGAEATGAEVEPNPVATPQTLTVPGRVSGVIGADGADGADVDAFTFTAREGGMARVALDGAADCDLVLDVEDAAGTRLLRSDNGKGGAVEGAPNLGLEAGQVVKVVVREFAKTLKKKEKRTPRTTACAPYGLAVTLAPAPMAGEEKEPNDTAAFAGEAPVPGEVTGYAGWRRDRDVWKVATGAIPEGEALAVDVDAVPNVALRVEVLDATEAVLLERVGKTGEPVAVRNVAVKTGEPHVYVVVGASQGNLDERYTLRVRSAPLELDEESEPNDKVGDATPLADIPGAADGARVGFLGRGDVDVFKLDPADAPRTLHVTVEPPPGVDVALQLLDLAGAPVGAPVNGAAKGAAEQLPPTAVAPQQQLFVKVSAIAGGSDAVRYRLRWSAAAADLAPALEDP